MFESICRLLAFDRPGDPEFESSEALRQRDPFGAVRVYIDMDIEPDTDALIDGSRNIPRWPGFSIPALNRMRHMPWLSDSSDLTAMAAF